jgi:protocadherin Fat 1/2/3
MDPADGSIYLKKSLDHEAFSHHHFTVIATDKGVPSLSSTAHVWVTGKLSIFLFYFLSF